MRRASAGRRALLVAFAAVAAGGAVLGVAIVPATPLSAPLVEAASGLTMTADARYVVDPAGHRVHVGVELTATNRRKDTTTRRYYYDRSFLAVQPGTTNFRIASSGAKPTVRVERRTKTHNLLRIDFGKQLAAGASRTFSLTFDIADPGGAPTRTTRIGTSLVSFGAWGFGSEGTTGGSVAVVFPAGFSVSVEAAGLGAPTTDAAGNITFSTGSLARPLSFFAYFVADRPGAYTETALRIPIGNGTIPVTLRAWPDDPDWAKRVGGLLMRGLPALASDIGLPWPVDQPLIVEESVSRDASSFAGRYNPPTGRVEIAYYATPFVILHEAAHAWFDGSLVADRWASEGFASWYALRAAAAIGQKNVTGDVLTPALETVRIPLNAWAAPGVGDATVESAEYAAALELASLIAERAGPDGLTAVWRAIDEGSGAYQPSGPQSSPETAEGAPDWRGLLDQLEEQTTASYDDLWLAWVVRPNEAGLLAERATARAAHAAIAERAAPWRLPRVIRDALRVWQYDQATDLLTAANAALDDRASVAAAALTAELVAPSTMQIAFEGPAGFSAASAEADAELAAIGAYREASAARPDRLDLIQVIGLWNSHPDDALERAAAAFEDGELHATVEAAALARHTWQTAAEIGRNRVIAVIGSLAALILGGWLVFRWFRDRAAHRRPLVVKG